MERPHGCISKQRDILKVKNKIKRIKDVFYVLNHR